MPEILDWYQIDWYQINSNQVFVIHVMVLVEVVHAKYHQRAYFSQISPWDHISLAVFWMQNSLSVVLFHYFWKMQSDVWGIYNIPNQKIMHISGGDFSVHSSTMNGWLRNFLWSQPAQVIQSYRTSISGYGFIFISFYLYWPSFGGKSI